ncbi:MAG: DHA2 family efflux MFS transporter permease subunit [Streptosporangiaceae bacterium]
MATPQPARLGKDEGFDPELKKLALVVLLGAVMTILDTTIVNVAVNTLGTEFDTSLATIQWVLTAYTLALSMSIPITAWAVARFGAKRMWMLSLILFVIGSALCGAAWSVGSLIVFRAIQGIGAGMIMPIGQTMLAQKAGPQRMGRVMAVIAVPAMLAPVLGPVLGGLIIDHLSWRWMFYVNVPLCALALVAALRMLPRDVVQNASAKLDVVGLLLLSPGLAALVYGMSEAGNGSGLTSPKVVVGVIAGLALIAAFVFHALRLGERALVDVRLFRDRNFSVVNLAFFTYVGALFGMMVLLPLYFQVVEHQTPLQSGLMTAPLGLGAMLTMPISGKLSDRLGAWRLSLVGLPVMLLGVFGYTQIHADTANWLLLAILFVIGLGHGTLMPALMGGMYRTLDRVDVPSATVAANITMRIGSSIGVAALAVVLQIAIQDVFPQTDGSLDEVAAASASGGAAGNAEVLLTHAFTTGFWWAFAFAAVAVIPILLIPRTPKAAAEPKMEETIPVP